MTEPDIDRDVTYRRNDPGVHLSLEFKGKNATPYIHVKVINDTVARFPLTPDRFDGLEQLLQAGRDHQSQLRYDTAAKERLAEREAAKQKQADDLDGLGVLVPPDSQS